MSQELINQITRLTRAIEALAERVTVLERPAPPTAELPDSPYPYGEQPFKRGPGRPRKNASDDAH